MAARSGTGRSPTSSSSQTREMMGWPSYEDIEPKSAEWKEEKTAHILIVHLPDFVKEQIRVTYDDNSRSFNVQGARSLGNNRFGRLNKDFTVPDSCKMKDMQGRFQDEVLTITIPKQYVSPFFDHKESTTSAQSPPENAPIVTHKPPARQSDHEKSEYRKREPSGKSLDDDSDVAGFAGKGMMRPKNPDFIKPKAGEIKSGVVHNAKKKVGEAEKGLIANVGVAALVLVSFGAYVGYNFACSRSAKD
ncbi:SHSP domain-containing protein [Psidium guajava]|nr:SHSP domain-containing protein [Psidium guajava]